MLEKARTRKKGRETDRMTFEKDLGTGKRSIPNLDVSVCGIPSGLISALIFVFLFFKPPVISHPTL